MALTEQFKNFASTTITTAINSGTTTLLLADATAFPTLSGSQYFYAVLTDSINPASPPTKREIVKVTARTGNTLTVTRAQDGTSAQAWDANSYIELRVVAATFTDVHDQTVVDARTDTGSLTLTADSDNNGVGNHVRVIGVTTKETLTSTYDSLTVPLSQPRELSVAAYGALGDYNPFTGAGTNDTAAIQAALDAAYAAGGGTVMLENKRYKLGSSISVPAGVHLRGPNTDPTIAYLGFGTWTPDDLVGYQANVTGPTWNPLGNTATTDGLGHRVTIRNDSATDHSAKTVALIGTDYLGNAITETVALPGPSGITQSYQYFKTLTSAIPSASIGIDTMDIGWNGGIDPTVGGSGWIAGGRLIRAMGGSLWACFDAGVGDGTATYNVAYSHGLPNYTTRTAAVYVRGEISNLNVFQYSYDNNKNATYTDSATWNSAWNSGYMSGLAVRLTADDAVVRNVYIGGFMQAVLGYAVARPTIDTVWVDCLNGIELVNAFDRPYINKVHGYIFCNFGNSSGSLVRRGDFVYLHDTVDWADVTSCFTYGHKWGFYLDNTNEASLTNCAADNTSAEVAGYYAVYIGANTQDPHITNFRAANRQYGIYTNNGNTNLTSVANATLLEVDYGYYVNSGNLRVVGGKITMFGANKIGFYNASTGTMVILGPLVTSATTIFSGANFTYLDQTGQIFTSGTAPFIRLDDTTDDVAVQMYSDAATDLTIDAFQASNFANKRKLYLNKYGGNVGVGDGVFQLDGGQIEFPAVANPSANANTLDDYQEEDFTPALAGSTTAGTQTYSTQLGISTKIGRQVTATFNLALTAKDGASAGNLRITGFPIAAGSAISYAVFWSRITNIDLDVAGGFYTVVGEMPAGQTYINLFEAGDNVGQTALTVADFNATTVLSGTVIYNV